MRLPEVKTTDSVIHYHGPMCQSNDSAGPQRLARILARLEVGLVERGDAVRLIFLAALAGEHSLLIGPPGAAKSELARRLHRVFDGARYFERLLTRFSVPEELFGPLSISALEQDRYERQTAGFLPEATIAFIDEVFKANSAILNALLTLLNEREFDNGAGRQQCPLVSVVGATNDVPDDEVGEAFFDRFLVRLQVVPVSRAGFRALMTLSVDAAPEPVETSLSDADRAALKLAASRVQVSDEVLDLLAELRDRAAAESMLVSDRRWVKILSLLRMAAATEERGIVSAWDLWLLPPCVAADSTGQQAVHAWLATRLGVQEAMSPPRLTRAVEAFEAQLDAEQKANDLDYDDSGRLRFSPDALADDVGDAKGGAQALRMTYQRKRRYGDVHIGARTAQIDALRQRLVSYQRELADRQRELADYRRNSLWVNPDGLTMAQAKFDETGTQLAALQRRLSRARDGFAALPRLDEDVGTVPDPIEFG